MHQRRFALAQEPGVADRAAQDPPQHVAAPVAGGKHPVGEQEGDGPRVVGEHPVGRALRPTVVVAPHDFDGALDDRREQVRVEVGGHALHDRGDALQTGPRVHGGSGERGAGPVGLKIELHEHEVPDLEQIARLAERHELVEVQLPFPAPRFPLPAGVNVDLRARPRGSGVAHLPEVVFVPQTEDAPVGDAGDLAPQPPGLVVLVVDRDGEAGGVDPQPVRGGHPLPRVGDRLLLEVVPEGEVAQHLEEGVVAGGMAHLLQVVVLAAGANALLAGGRAGIVAALHALKHPLELHHPRVGEQQGGVVRRHQRRAGDLAVVPGRNAEVFEELAADLGGLHGGKYIQILRACGAQDDGAPSFFI